MNASGHGQLPGGRHGGELGSPEAGYFASQIRRKRRGAQGGYPIGGAKNQSGTKMALRRATAQMARKGSCRPVWLERTFMGHARERGLEGAKEAARGGCLEMRLRRGGITAMKRSRMCRWHGRPRQS